jgi:perosamine synthetase
MDNPSAKIKKILITGENSRFGKELKKTFFGKNIIYTNRHQLDILDIKSIDRCFNKYKPNYLIHLASLSRPMIIHEKDIASSIDANIIGTANIVKKCWEKNIKLIYFSTNYVYPGTKGNYHENDPLLPVNSYAWSKLGGEASVNLYKNSLILRLAMTEYPFIHDKAFVDAKVNFVYRDEVIRMLPSLLDHFGIINIGSNKSESIYSFAKKSKHDVKPISIKNIKNFPVNSSVNINKLNNILKKRNQLLIKDNKKNLSKYKPKKILLSAGPSITQLEREIVDDMMRFGWDGYNYVEKFEKEFARYHDRKFCLLTPSCTLAIYLAIKSLKIKNNDEVIVPDVTWTATVSPIVEAGAKPVFVDIDKNNWCIDLDHIKKKITKKTKAIVCVDLYGNMPNILELKNFCKKNKIILLEDSAEALGTEYNGLKAGKFGDISFHSFHRTKTITSGEGGALLTDNEKIFKIAKHLRDLGRSEKNSYIANTASLKFMPSNLQAAMVYGQFKRLNELLQIKRNIFNEYKKNLSDLKVEFNQDNQKLKNGLWASVIKFDEKYKTNIPKLIKFLKKNNIYAREFFRPLSSQHAYKKYRDKNIKRINKVSYSLFKNSLVLPSHYNLNAKDIFFISKKLKSYIKKN